MQIKKELPEIFGEFGEMRQKSFLAAYEMKQKNIPFVGTFCTYFPQEIAMAMGACVVGLCSTSDETIPDAEKAFADLEWQVKNDVSHLMFREGEFTTLQNGLTVFITAHEKDGSVQGVLINDERDPKAKVTVSAEHGVIIYTEKGPRLIMINGVRQEIDNKSGQFSSLSFDRYSIDFGTTSSGKKRDDSARSKTLTELFDAGSNPELTPQEANRYILEGHRRLMNPFYNLVMALLACTGLLVGNFNRRGQGKIISCSIAAMVLIEAGDLAFGNLCGKSLYFLTLLYANLIVPFIVCLYLLFFYNPAWFTRRNSNRSAR